MLQNTQDINIVTKRYPPSKSSMVETFELWQRVFKRSLNRDNRNCAKFISLLTELLLLTCYCFARPPSPVPQPVIIHRHISPSTHCLPPPLLCRSFRFVGHFCSAPAIALLLLPRHPGRLVCSGCRPFFR